MAGCNYHSEKTGKRCTCSEFEQESDNDKCSTCNHTEKVHTYSEAVPASSQRNINTKSLKLLKALTSTGKFSEANSEANKNLVAPKSSSTSHSHRKAKSALNSSTKEFEVGSSGKFSVAKVFLLPLGLVLDDMDFLSLRARLKFDSDVAVVLRNMNLAATTNSKDDFTFNQRWSASLVEKKLEAILGAPMEHLIQLAAEERASQWRLLKSSGGFLKLKIEDSPDGQSLYEAKGTGGKSWVYSIVAIISVQTFTPEQMEDICGINWERNTRRLLNLIGWNDEFETLFGDRPQKKKQRLTSPTPSIDPKGKGKKRAYSPFDSSNDNDDEASPEDLPLRKRTSARIAQKPKKSPPLFLNEGDSPKPEPVNEVFSSHETDSGDNYQPSQPSSPVPKVVPMNAWNLSYKLEFLL
ncbi:hypothetical protein EV360DRAFT_69503 [Lentinula raphanica]|nr:hypothetical protein EV360DRAFT_69503 [Lentinula raphanica]